MASHYRQQLEHYLSNLSIAADRVLDIGGSANPVRSRVKAFYVRDYVILDNDNEKEYHEKWNKPDMVWDMNYDINLYPDTFDDFNTIFMLEVMEYIWDPVQAIKNISEMLGDDGVAFVSFPSIYPVHEPVQSDSLRFTKQWIEKVCGQFFADIEVTPRVATAGRDHLSAFYSLEKMRAAKNSDIIYDIGYIVRLTK